MTHCDSGDVSDMSSNDLHHWSDLLWHQRFAVLDGVNRRLTSVHKHCHQFILEHLLVLPQILQTALQEWKLVFELGDL